MGKVEDMKALREQLRAEAAAIMAGEPKRGGKGVRGQSPAMVILDELAPADELCGHRSIGNKSCTRPSNHAEKNHRYGKTA